MAIAVPGVTTSFELNANTPTQLSAARFDPSGRVYVRIDNRDKNNAIAFAVGTGGQATASHHVIPPGSFYEFRWQWPSGMPPPQPGWGLFGDISAIALSGNPTISYLEL